MIPPLIKKWLPNAAAGLLLISLFYQSHQASKWEEQSQTLQKQTVQLSEQSHKASVDHEALTKKVTSQQIEISKLRRDVREIPTLKAEINRLQGTDTSNSPASAQRKPQTAPAHTEDDPFGKAVMALASRAAELNRHIQSLPAYDIPELQFLSEGDWLSIAKGADFDSEEGVRRALSKVRQKAKNNFGEMAAQALNRFAAANQGQAPSDPLQLAPYFDSSVDQATLQRYQMVSSTGFPGLQQLGQTLLSEKSPIDRQFDTHLYIGPKGVASFATGIDGTNDPDKTWSTR